MTEPRAIAETTERRFVFQNGAFRHYDTAPDAPATLLVADSWLVDDGRARALDLHRERFVRSSLARGDVDSATLDAFWRAALDAIPPIHRWFPRVELWAGQPGAADGSSGAPAYTLALLMRLAPPPASSAVLATHSGEDPRSIPGVKGPDLARLTGLRNAARASGVDDLVLTSADGSVVEGTTTALLWWRGDELYVPTPELERVDSVTAKTMLVLAKALGVRVTEQRVPPSALAGSEVWAVNALYGIRLVTKWQGVEGLVTDPARSQLWQQRLDLLAR